MGSHKTSIHMKGIDKDGNLFDIKSHGSGGELAAKLRSRAAPNKPPNQ
jgi:hypothetical protein